MPELIEQMYCSQQIVIPPKFPYILKRYCKAAIKTQPYDLLRWSFEYFKALAQHRPPPVKLRLEYPIYSTEGGLTRGCLKVLANQMAGMDEVPLQTLKRAWQGFCLDPEELRRVLCLCEVYLRQDSVSFLCFIAVAAGLLTKCLTHTMILTCETLTKEPDGGSAAIPIESFLKMYHFLARVDASKDTRYLNGYKEGVTPPEEQSVEDEVTPESEYIESEDEKSLAEFMQSSADLHKLTLINDHVTKNTKISMQIHKPVLFKIVRSPSLEREAMIERENYMRERIGRPNADEDVDEMLRQMSTAKVEPEGGKKEAVKQEKAVVVEKKDGVEIHVYNENNAEIPFEIYGQPKEVAFYEDEETELAEQIEEEDKTEPENMAEKIALYVAESYRDREDRLEDLEQTFIQITSIVDRYKTTSYDLGMIAGRQMSSTSGEFIVAHIEKEIMSYIDEQIGILPDPDLKKKKAKPEEVEMVRGILETFLDENMDIIIPELEEVEEEEQAVPEVTVVYAVPGIGGVVDEDIIREFEEYALDVSHVQADVFMPRNIRHFLCPPLEKYQEHKYEEDQTKKEEVATGGAFAES